MTTVQEHKPGNEACTPVQGELLSVTPGPATIHELRGALVGADAAFIVSQMEANATLAQAKDAWIVRQSELLAAQKQALEDAKVKAPGVPAVGSGKAKAAGADDAADAGGGGDAAARWDEAVAAQRKKGLDPQAAVRAVRRADPELHEAYVAEHNERFEPVDTARKRLAKAG